MATKDKPDDRLSPLGRRVEAVLLAQLTVMEKEVKAAEKAKREPKYSLTDLTKVWDRAIKLEAIRQRMAGDEEGSFYDPQNRGQTDGNERPD